MEKTNMNKKDWITIYKQDLKHYEEQIKEFTKFEKQAKNYEVKKDLERSVSFNKERALDCKRRIKCLEELK